MTNTNATKANNLTNELIFPDTREHEVVYDPSFRNIYLNGNIDDDNVITVIVSMQALEAEDPTEPINLFINSDGGYIYSAFALYDVIRTLQCKVNTYALGRACSAGAFLLAAGTGVRGAYRNSRIMIHQASLGFTGKINDMEIYHNEAKKVQDMVVKVLSERTGKDVDIINKDLKDDKWMSAEEALAYGLVDRIV